LPTHNCIIIAPILAAFFEKSYFLDKSVPGDVLRKLDVRLHRVLLSAFERHFGGEIYRRESDVDRR